MEQHQIMDLLQQASEIVRQAGQLFFQEEKRSAVHSKGRMDFVTDVDTSVQAFLQQTLQELLPDAQFLGEEKDNSDIDHSGLVWINDPVDGTTNLIHNFCHSVVSLGLTDGGELILGLVYDPYRDELFTAMRGMGAYCNGIRIQVSQAQELSDCLTAVGTAPGNRDYMEQSFALMRAMFERCHDVRRMGSAALDLCYVAAGRLDLYTEAYLNPWDIAAGTLIVREAGGIVTDNFGNALPLDRSTGVLAGNPEVHPKALEVIKQYSKDGTVG